MDFSAFKRWNLLNADKYTSLTFFPPIYVCYAPIYGLVRNRITFEGIAILKNLMHEISYSKFSKFSIFSLSVLCMHSLMMREMWNVLFSVDQESKWGCEEEGHSECFLMSSGQTDKRFYTSICLVQYWLKLKINGTAMKLTTTKVRVVLPQPIKIYFRNSKAQMNVRRRLAIFCFRTLFVWFLG